MFHDIYHPGNESANVHLKNGDDEEQERVKVSLPLLLRVRRNIDLDSGFGVVFGRVELRLDISDHPLHELRVEHGQRVVQDLDGRSDEEGSSEGPEHRWKDRDLRGGRFEGQASLFALICIKMEQNERQ